MYQVTCVTDGVEHTLMDMRDDEYTLIEPKLTLQLNSAGTFTFKIPPTHPEIPYIRRIVTTVRIYRAGTPRKWVFSGRVMSDEADIYNTGKVKCEGILAYLVDSIVYPYSFQGTPADYVTQLITSHNSQVDEEKRFTIRTLDLADADSNNNIVRANKNYPTTSQEFKDKVVKLLDAYISVEETGEGLMFDCTQTITHYNTQVIELGTNIIDLKKTVSADTVRTVMTGIGAEDDNGDRISVTVENADAIRTYGRIVGTVEFEDVTTMSQLTAKTEAYLQSVITETRTVEVRAIDLNMTDSEIDELTPGYTYVNSAYNGMEHERMLISKMDIYLLQPDKNTITLGAEKKSLSSTITHTNAEISSKVQQVEKTTSQQIESKVANATQLITGSKGGYVVIDTSEESGKPEQILVMDAPEKDNAKNVIRLNKNGIGFSTSGYDGIYRNAWTIDGNLVADFITAGTMSADRIEGGTLTLGGKDNTYGSLIVKDADGTQAGKWDKDGIILPSQTTINGGIIKGGTINGSTIISTNSYDTSYLEIAGGYLNGYSKVTNSSGEDEYQLSGRLDYWTHMNGEECMYIRAKNLAFANNSIKVTKSMSGDVLNMHDYWNAIGERDVKYCVNYESGTFTFSVLKIRNGFVVAT